MSFFITLSVVVYAHLLLTTEAITVIDIRNNCPFTVWAAAVPGGGRRLDYGGAWRLQAVTNATARRVWGRTNCNFDETGQGQCQTGDCNGLLECQADGTPPNTLVEYALNQNNNNLDYFDISLVNGFNVPVEFISDGCSQRVSCTADIIGSCPIELRVAGGCNNPCTVFNTNQYCCISGTCGPTNLSNFFKDRCPDAYTYPLDVDSTSTFTCPTGANYRVVFCP